MKQVIEGQVLFVLATVCTGMGLMAGYDLLRFWRWLWRHGPLWIWLEDLFYWCVAAVPVFYLFFCFQEGQIRWYGLAGLLTGSVLYEVGISLPVRRLLRRAGVHLKKVFLRPLRSHLQQKRQSPVERKVKKRL